MEFLLCIIFLGWWWGVLGVSVEQIRCKANVSAGADPSIPQTKNDLMLSVAVSISQQTESNTKRQKSGHNDCKLFIKKYLPVGCFFYHVSIPM